ncbi:polysaccharide biosynthesis C-terminal domain-containing protein [Gallibacterium genomosp. 1]|uniref:Polysaccharide biosynthesis protein C-terminal domain-containing protein n=1 Tax=Gallibacterium genomosp. 1 TaxID=155515 RepID=A0AB36DV42_9PAST|nr:polysaccharide biosynthesis C-terminal domain-containing protein [Gallibacterium genomosp. 1]OBX00323.1 hypothetical protein QV05_08080 [Gallibacterium genomosp. 1]OBX00356.1 hypothetical protein QV04_06605 [Gallibacterium genomosp. 1]
MGPSGDSRKKKAKLNIIVSLVTQVITLVCGMLVPWLIINKFGSEAYGATVSITQFLGYIALLEGGIGGVARAALYKPLANRDKKTIFNIILELKKFFRLIAYFFIVYVLVLACSFHTLAHVEIFDWISTFLLVIVISISIFAQYFLGITYSILIQASQRIYITNIINMLTLLLNVITVFMLVYFGYSLIIIKLASSCIFILRPILMWRYIKIKFGFLSEETKKKEENILKQKWIGLGQHIAYFLHSNTDIGILTIFSDLKFVAVYSIYNMIVFQIQNFAVSFSSGIESYFGDILAKKEYEILHQVFNRYELLLSIVSVILFSVTTVMITPFIAIYTHHINDISYDVFTFALLLILSSFVTTLRVPYHNLIIAAGHFKETQLVAYGEVAINLFLSVILVYWLGLVGVAIGTLVAISFRFLFYVYYLSNKIFNRKKMYFFKRSFINSITFFFIIWIGLKFRNGFIIDGYFDWIICSCLVTTISLLIVFLINYLFYKREIAEIIHQYVKGRIDKTIGDK